MNKQPIPLTPKELERLNKYHKEDMDIKQAVKVVNKAIKSIVRETTDKDIQYEVGKAWGITKDYLNVQ